jgi:hypothetical protein
MKVWIGQRKAENKPRVQVRAHASPFSPARDANLQGLCRFCLAFSCVAALVACSTRGVGPRPAYAGSELAEARGAEESTVSDGEVDVAWPSELELDRPHPRWFELHVPEHRPSFVVLPSATSGETAWPYVVAAHGAGDNSYYQCRIWEPVFRERAVLLCPAGLPMTRDEQGGYFFRDHFALEREVVAALDALQQILAERVRSTSGLYVAYSQGATMGSLMLTALGQRFPRLLLLEGGSHEWNVSRATAYRESGGERVLFACGTSSCDRGAVRSTQWLEQGGVAARARYAKGAGHTYGGAVQRAALEELDWLVEGLPGF